MFRKTIYAVGPPIFLALVLFVGLSRVTAQDVAKPLDPDSARLNFSFPIQPGGRPFRFKVELDQTGMITGISVFSEGKSSPLQTLPACAAFPEPVTDRWDDHDISMLLKHADLNFDGSQDLELLRDHGNEDVYCIYLWDNQTGRFRYASEVSDVVGVDPEPHPADRTITSSEYWLGGASQSSTYRWIGDKLELVEQESLLGDWSMGGFTFSCSRLVKGKMVITLKKTVKTQDQFDHLPDCPAAAASPLSRSPKEKQ